MLSILLAVGLVGGHPAANLVAAEPAAELPREFRGVWVATVANIDWPSKPGLEPSVQQRELIAILDRSVALNLNAIVFQIRPSCDALYPSKIEPWSEYLTGASGKAPEPAWDPLEFAVTEAHARGLELHVWFNPYRAWHPSAKSPIPDSHIVKRRPDLAPRYGKHHWMIPTEPEVQDHSMAVILDVVRRYDIDGVHLDDYFYPYAEKDSAGKEIPFPDDASWERYTRGGGKLARDDWRRDAVNRFVKRLHDETHAVKRHVKVGISPFGIWRPGHPPGIEGFDQYAGLYADARLWFREGQVDYFTPQLYWPIARTKQSYPKLLGWWAGENVKGRHLWPGNIPSRVGSSKEWPPEEIFRQIEATRATRGATGNVHFSMKALMKEGALADELRKAYPGPALIPASPWLEEGPVGPLDASVRRRKNGEPSVTVTPTKGTRWLLAERPGRANSAKVHFVGERPTLDLRVEPRTNSLRLTPLGPGQVAGVPVEVRIAP
jgi:uncharacterized lipoprotein YddW (UPF0748 family)